MGSQVMGAYHTSLCVSRAGIVRGALALVCLASACALAACNLVGVQVEATNSTTHQSTALATATLPPPGGPAVLGAPGQAFIARYGPPTNQSTPAQGDLHFHQYAGVATDYLIVEEGKYVGVTPGDADAWSILVAGPPGQPWPLTTAKQVCAGFGPPDAQFVSTVTTSAQGAEVGWDDIYQSARLATIFPASAFQTINQTPAPAGSFDIHYIYASTSDTAHVGSCSLVVGEG